MISEIKFQDLNARQFIEEKVSEIATSAGDGIAINALSGGVDSSVVTMLGHRALGKKLRTVFIQNGLMREGEPEAVAGIFRKLGVNIEIIEARKEFLDSLKGITDPEKKREAITQTFYKKSIRAHCQGEWIKISSAGYYTDGCRRNCGRH